MKNPFRLLAPSPKAHHLRVGEEGENAAVLMLQKRGWAILARNWRKPPLELDIICKDGETIVFVEVKTRKSTSRSRPDEAFTKNKQQHIVKAAAAWLTENAQWDRPCRFDLVTVTYHGEHYNTELIQHVIELSHFSEKNGNSLGGRYSSWQPW